MLRFLFIVVSSFIFCSLSSHVMSSQTTDGLWGIMTNSARMRVEYHQIALSILENQNIDQSQRVEIAKQLVPNYDSFLKQIKDGLSTRTRLTPNNIQRLAEKKVLDCLVKDFRFTSTYWNFLSRNLCLYRQSRSDQSVILGLLNEQYNFTLFCAEDLKHNIYYYQAEGQYSALILDVLKACAEIYSVEIPEEIKKFPKNFGFYCSENSDISDGKPSLIPLKDFDENTTKCCSISMKIYTAQEVDVSSYLTCTQTTPNPLLFIEQLMDYKNSLTFIKADDLQILAFQRYILPLDGLAKINPCSQEIKPKPKKNRNRNKKTAKRRKNNRSQKKNNSKRNQSKPKVKVNKNSVSNPLISSTLTLTKKEEKEEKQDVLSLETTQTKEVSITPEYDQSEEDQNLQKMEQSIYESYLTPFQQYLRAGGSNAKYLRQLKAEHDRFLKQETLQHLENVNSVPINLEELEFYRTAIWGPKSKRGNFSWNQIMKQLTSYGWNFQINHDVSSGLTPPAWFKAVGMHQFMISVHKDHKPDNKPVKWYCLYYLRTGFTKLGLTLGKIESLRDTK